MFSKLNNNGSLFIGIIITITIMASLGAGILYFTTTSTSNGVNLISFYNANYLANVGYRFASAGSTVTGTAQGINTYTLDKGPQSNSNSLFTVNIPVSTRGNITSTGVVNSGTIWEARQTIQVPFEAGGGGGAGGSVGSGTGSLPVNSSQAAATSNPSGFTASSLSLLNQGALTNAETGGVAGTATFQGTNGVNSAWLYLANLATPGVITDSTGAIINAHADSTGCQIGYIAVPLAFTGGVGSTLQCIYNLTGTVSYTVQAKVGWLNTMRAAASGLNFRWHAVGGAYEGFGVSYLLYTSTGCNGSDFISPGIEPAVNAAGNAVNLAGQLMVVLWEQTVNGSGVPTFTWIAYALLGNPAGQASAMEDPMVVGNQSSVDGWVDDDSSIGVRVEDTFLFTGQRVTDIKVFYGDDSLDAARTTGTRGQDINATDVTRAAYPPQWAINGSTWVPAWPSLNFGLSTSGVIQNWSYSGWQSNTLYNNNTPLYNGTTRGDTVIPLTPNGHCYECVQSGTSGTTEPVWPTASGARVTDNTVTWQENGSPTSANMYDIYDYFTILSSAPYPNPPSLPAAPNNVVQLVMNPKLPASVHATLLGDGCTIRTTDFPLTSFPTGRPELALHGMGNFTGGYGNASVAFNDFAIQIEGLSESSTSTGSCQ